jgi:simple sugar transport system permease protein
VADVTFIESVLAGGVRLAVPLGLAAVGELINERAGVLNLGVEGTMAMGAAGGVIGAASFGTIPGLVAGAAVGALLGLVFGLLVVVVGADEVICGFAVALGGSGLAIFLYRSLYGAAPEIEVVKAVDVPVLGQLPLIGPVLFQQPLVIWLLPLAVLAVAVVLTRTHPGLSVRAAGDGPAEARARGIDIDLVRVLATVAGGALAGLGGAVLCVGLVGEFSDRIIGGRGFLALALVIAARWRPGLLLPIVIGIGSLQSLQLRVQAEGAAAAPVELLQMLPYVVTIAVLAIGLGSGSAPRALGRLGQERFA